MGVSERRKFKATNRLARGVSRTVVINFIRLGWVVCIVWGELGVYFWSLSSCKWPEITEWRQGKPTHVLLISDPQVRHPSALWAESSWVKSLGQFLYELNLKRSWHVTRRLNPHAVFFLGDMLSVGKFASSEAEYKAYWQNFRDIFQSDATSPHHYIPGNNDVGMGLSHSSPKNVRLYYSNVVGPFNQHVVIRDHVFICLDAPGLVDDDYRRSGIPYEQWNHVRGGSVEFINSVSTAGRPLILLSHIPLARPDAAACGPLREKGAIRRGVGHGYQNTLGKDTTAFLLKTLRPSAVFSGDNRDYCEYHHPVEAPDHKIEESTIREVTIKSFSMSVHIRRPGFQLVSIVDPTPNGKSFVDAPCLLPDTSRIYTSLYTPLTLLTLVFLFVFNTYRSRRLRIVALPLNLSPLSNSSHSLHPGSNVWSPYTPPVPVSPLNQLPPSLRAANASAAPTMRASRPATPLGSPMLSPAIVFQHEAEEEEEEDSLYPTQYALQRNGHVGEGGEEWPAPRDDPSPSFLLPVSGNPKPSAAQGWSWSWTFVFRGRRRRMTISVPTWNSMRELAEQLSPGADRDMLLRRRGVFWTTVIDSLGIIWPTLLLWILFAWWML